MKFQGTPHMDEASSIQMGDEISLAYEWNLI